MKRLAVVLLMMMLAASSAIAENVVKKTTHIFIGESSISGKFTGKFENDLPNGYGVFDAQSQIHHEPYSIIGKFVDGKLSGDCKIIWNMSEFERGEYKDGKPIYIMVFGSDSFGFTVYDFSDQDKKDMVKVTERYGMVDKFLGYRDVDEIMSYWESRF